MHPPPNQHAHRGEAPTAPTSMHTGADAHRTPTSMHTGGRHPPECIQGEGTHSIHTRGKTHKHAHKRHTLACTGTLNLPVCNKQKGNMSELVNLKPLDKLDLQHHRTVENYL